MSNEKSMMEKIKEFIETCPLLEGGKINVDYLEDEIDSYSIDRTPNEPQAYNYIDGYGGKFQINFDFVVTAPLSSKAIDNLINSKFCEDFMEWIKTKNQKKELPQIDGAFSIKCTSPGYILQKTEETAIYIIQLAFTYYELT